MKGAKILVAMLMIVVLGLCGATSVSADSIYLYEYDGSRLASVITIQGTDYYRTTFYYDSNGNLLKKTKKKISEIEAPAEVELSSASYEIYAYGLNAAAASVTFYTWADAGGQVSKVSIPGIKIGDGVWKAVVPLSNHRNVTGLYYNDVWVDGEYFGGAATVVKSSSKVIAPTSVKFIDGFYEVIVEGVPENVVKMTFPSWTDHQGQDDLKHTEGEKIGPGKWRGKISFSEHHYETGKYITHVYSHDSSGNQVGWYGVHVQVVGGVEAPLEVELSSASYEVFAHGLASNITAVMFYTWTNANGQDDLASIPGIKISGGVWKAVVPLSNHGNETGLYYNDVWAGGQYIGGAATVVKNS